ncbi:MAG: helix-turn-helix transcriptional regulator [Pseudomonadota bacterium]
MSGFKEGFGSRVASVINLYDSKKQAADTAGLTTDSLARYRREVMKPSFEPMYKLCTPYNISLDWLATGEGSMYKSEVNEPTPTHREPPPEPKATEHGVNIDEMFEWLVKSVDYEPEHIIFVTKKMAEILHGNKHLSDYGLEVTTKSMDILKEYNNKEENK